MATVPDEISIIDYLLGFMTARQRRRMNRRMASDTALRDAVETLHEGLHPLSTLAKPVAPPAEVWQAVQTRLTTPAQVIPSRSWVWALPTGTAVATTLALAVWTRQMPVYRADLQASTPGTTTVRHLASIEADRRNDIVITVDDMPPPPAGKSFELWIIPPGGKPRSLGVMPDAKVIRVHADTLPEHATLAVSLEPASGSPTGQPTGPVVASSELQRL